MNIEKNTGRYSHFLSLILITVIAAGLRFYWGQFRSLWGDELHTYHIISHVLSGPESIFGKVYLILHDAHMPLYFFLLSLWSHLAGTGEFALRNFSLLIGLLTIPAVYKFGEISFGKKAGLLAAFLTAISPSAIMMSHEIRVYGLMILLSSLSGYYLVSILKQKRSFVKLTGYFAFTLLLGLTHIYSALLIISQLIYILYQLFKHKDRKPDLLAVAVINLLALGISCVFYGYLIYLCMGILLSSSTDMAYSVFPAIAKPFLFLFVLSLGETLAPWNISVIPSMIAFGYLAFIAARRMNEGVNALMLLCVFLPIIVAAFFLKPSMPKYLLSTLPFYLVLLSGQLTFVTRRLALAALAVIIFSSMVSVFNYYSLTDYHNSNQVEPWREVSGLIRDNYDKQDAIIVTNTALIKGALDYYLSNGDKTSRYRIYNLEDGINALSAKRIWLISHIADDRNLPPGEKQIMLSLLHDRKYKKQSTFSYIPYEKTLVSKLPIKRHVEGSYRITIDLYTAQ